MLSFYFTPFHFILFIHVFTPQFFQKDFLGSGAIGAEALPS